MYVSTIRNVKIWWPKNYTFGSILDVIDVASVYTRYSSTGRKGRKCINNSRERESLINRKKRRQMEAELAGEKLGRFRASLRFTA